MGTAPDDNWLTIEFDRAGNRMDAMYMFKDGLVSVRLYVNGGPGWVGPHSTHLVGDDIKATARTLLRELADGQVSN